MDKSLGDIILGHEPQVRLSIFLGVFALVAAAEALLPRRRSAYSRLARWPGNIGIVVVKDLLSEIMGEQPSTRTAREVMREAVLSWLVAIIRD